jgi:hypothetical protein
MPTYTNKDLNGPNPTRFSNWPREFPQADDQPISREDLIAQSFRPEGPVTYGPDSVYGEVDPNGALAGAHRALDEANNFDESITPHDLTFPHPVDDGVLSQSERQPSVTDSLSTRFGKIMNDMAFRHHRAMEQPVERYTAPVIRGLAMAAGTAGVGGMFPAIAGSDLLSGGTERLKSDPIASAIDAAVAVSPAFGAVGKYVNGAREAETAAAEGEARIAESATRAGEHSKARYNARQAEAAGFPRSSVQEGLAGHEPVGGEYLHPKAPRSISTDISNPSYVADSSVNDLGQSAGTQARYPSITKPAGGYPEPRSLAELRNALANDPELAAKAFGPAGRGAGFAGKSADLGGENINWPAMGRGPSPTEVSPAFQPTVTRPAFGVAPDNVTAPAMGRAPLQGIMDALKTKPVDPIESAIEASGVHRPIQDIMAQREAFDMGGSAGPVIKSGLGSRDATQAELYAKALKKMEGSTGDTAENLAAKITERPRTVESRSTNGSGDSTASSEGISAVKSMKTKGQKFVTFNRGGSEGEIASGLDTRDVQPAKGQTIAIKHPDGTYEIYKDNGGRIPPGLKVRGRR